MTTLGLAACSGGDESSEAAVVDTTVADVGQTTEPAAEAGEDAEVTTTEAPEPAPLVFDVLATEPTAPGPRPLLSWADVEGATTYDLIVLDAAGSPYWAWSGEATSVFLGGVENPDAVGAWVFEPLTWIVTARDATGEPLAMSASAELLP